EQLREDAAALDGFAEEVAEDLAEHAEAGISLPVAALASNPAALRQRLIRLVVQSEFGVSLSRAQTLEVARLVTDWHGQAGVDLPGVRVVRRGGRLEFGSREEN
ncbi:MAG TPA: TilS substrate-binding domain-containing protein, partial [Pseudolysinimonas sp.]